MEYDISNYMRQINRYRFDNVGGLVVDLRADMMELSKKNLFGEIYLAMKIIYLCLKENIQK